MKFKILVIAMFVVNAIVGPTVMKADASLNGQFFHEFAKALHDKDVSKLNSLIEPNVKIPEIREKTPISGLETAPSPRKNTFIMIGSFREDCSGYPGECERTAFIWEVTIKGHKISNIKVLSDLANPLMNELYLTKEYKEKFNKQILGPSYFPFKITHVSGKISGEKITLYYKNIKLPGVFEMSAAPTAGEITLPKGNMHKQVALKKGSNGFFGKTINGYELIFLCNNFQYNLLLHGKDRNYKSAKNELIKVANSILFFTEPWAKYPNNSDKKFKDAHSSINWEK